MNGFEHPGHISSHISVTRHTREGVTRTDVHITQLSSFASDDSAVAQMRDDSDSAASSADEAASADGMMMDGSDCFDPESCCDARERALIAMMRAYLRPQVAPECLINRLRHTLDKCCHEEEIEHEHALAEAASGAPGKVNAAHAGNVIVPSSSSTVVVRRVHTAGTDIVTIADLSVPNSWTFPTYPDMC